jgi:hypothetical protein
VDDVDDTGLEIRQIVGVISGDTNGPVYELSSSPVGSLVLKLDSSVEGGNVIGGSQGVECLQVRVC